LTGILSGNFRKIPHGMCLALLTSMMIKLNKLVKDTRGANLVEYIILVGVIALIALAGFKIFGKNVDQKIQDQAGKVSAIGN
jgi:pilus assembly protein Flp/PilA